MRQIVALQVAIAKRRVKYRYPMMVFMASLHNATLPDLEDILGENTPKFEDKRFDSKTDEFLQKRALEIFEERQREYGQRK